MHRLALSLVEKKGIFMCLFLTIFRFICSFQPTFKSLVLLWSILLYHLMIPVDALREAATILQIILVIKQAYFYFTVRNIFIPYKKQLWSYVSYSRRFLLAWLGSSRLAEVPCLCLSKWLLAGLGSENVTFYAGYSFVERCLMLR